MPAPGSMLKYGNRNYIFNKDFWKNNIVEGKELDISFSDCKSIIETCNKNIAQCVVDEIDGFKLPHGLGYLVAGKYMPDKPFIDWKRSNELGKHVYYSNLHTFGYAVKLYWFRVGRVSNSKFNEVFKFVGYKTLGKSVSSAFGSGKKPYSEWCTLDFIEKGRLENLYSKKYRKKELKEI